MGGVSNPKSQEKRDEDYARQLQQQEEKAARAAASRGGAAAGSSATNPPQAPPQARANWENAGTGHSLGGPAAERELSAEDKRQKALEAAEKRQNNVPGLAQ